MNDFIYPNCITVLATYQCTAACEECCFECNPHLTARLSLEEITNFITESNELFKGNLKGVVFSGGECFLLKDDLVSAVKYASTLGLSTRCVSNGYWGKTTKMARNRLQSLKDAGLREINISTGDDHQKFVKFESVLNCVIEAAELGINALIVVEGHESSNFKYDDVVNHPRFLDFKKNSKNASRISVFNNIWIPFNKDRKIVHNDELKQTLEKLSLFRGCDNILQNLVLTPHNKIACCCGLTMEHIPEMKIGDYSHGNLETCFKNQYQDFLKIWLWVEGPEKIYYFASQKNKNIKYNSELTHNCQACVEIYQNPLIKETIKQYWHEIFDEVMFKYKFKQKYFSVESIFVS
jgi:hypothetical protein